MFSPVMKQFSILVIVLMPLVNRCFVYFVMSVIIKVFNSVQDECLLEPGLYERAEKLFRELLPYVTDFLLWEESSELPAELQPQYDS